MIEQIFQKIYLVEDILWGYIVVPSIILLGFIISVRLKFPQINHLKQAIKDFFSNIDPRKNKASKATATIENKRGVSPIKAFFSSVGGCLGVANLVGVCSAIKLGGPGAVFWMWVAAFLGMAIKYAEVYLGMKFRIENKNGSYDGGPMYYLKKAFNNNYIGPIFAILMAIYGADMYMFSVVAKSLLRATNINFHLIIITLLIAIIYASNGGVARVGKISSMLIPFFLVIFLLMSSWILLLNINKIIPTFILIFKSAFTGHAAVGGFAGSTFLLAMSKGMARGCYTGDIGIGYAAIVHAESSSINPKKQANMAILGIILDTFLICTLTTLLVLVTNVWQGDYHSDDMTQICFSKYFPLMHIFMPSFLFILGYSSIIAFYLAGMKCTEFLFPKYGKILYAIIYSAICYYFCFQDLELMISIMAVVGGIILLLNVSGILKLRKHLTKS